MKIIRRELLFEKVEKALLKAYHHIPAELEAEKKRNLTNDVSPKAQKK